MYNCGWNQNDQGLTEKVMATLESFEVYVSPMSKRMNASIYEFFLGKKAHFNPISNELISLTKRSYLNEY